MVGVCKLLSAGILCSWSCSYKSGYKVPINSKKIVIFYSSHFKKVYIFLIER